MQGKSQEFSSVSQLPSSESAGTSQSHVSKVLTLTWYPFWESFESAVHKNPNLSSVDKFNYLQSLLTGIARSAIAGLALMSANYEKAVGLLKQQDA